jgi:glucosamine 6-phosphate synthetase-like amidotransferase/phosphosugar isomerase protein
MTQGKLLPEALQETANELTGMVLLSVFSIDEPDTIYITNWIQACYLGVGDDETIFSSSRLGLSHVWNNFDVFHAPRNSFIKLSRDGVEISKLSSSRNAPDPYLNPSILRDKVVDHLKKKGAMDSVAVIISLEKEGFRDIFDLEEEEWKKLLEIGYGDQNQLMENLNQFASDGFIHKKTVYREEGVVNVPRILWYA